MLTVTDKSGALRLTALYAVLAAAYIFLSDFAVHSISTSLTEAGSYQTLKGVAFVFVTAMLFYFYANKLLRQLYQRNRDLEKSQDALMIAEQRAMAGLVAAAVAHDSNNLLTGLRWTAQNLEAKTKAGPDEISKASQAMVQQIDKLSELARRLLDIGREKVIKERQRFNLYSFLEESITQFRKIPALRQCDIALRGSGDFLIESNKTMLQQILLNLLINSAEASEGKGNIEVYFKEDGALFSLEVHDDGPGVAAKDRERIFEPFYTTKSTGNGIGLLSVRTLCRTLGGAVTLEMSKLGGACFKVTFAKDPLKDALELNESNVTPKQSNDF